MVLSYKWDLWSEEKLQALMHYSTDQALVRAQKIVADTIEIGSKTAETLDSQTKQLEKVMDDLDEIQFTMQKAKQVIRDMTRSMATDK